eukprot:5638857-Pyramimonas_sp.AAC.1
MRPRGSHRFDARALAADYRALSQDDLANVLQEARAATLRHRLGGRSFGKRPLDIDRGVARGF